MSGYQRWPNDTDPQAAARSEREAKARGLSQWHHEASQAPGINDWLRSGLAEDRAASIRSSLYRADLPPVPDPEPKPALKPPWRNAQDLQAEEAMRAANKAELARRLDREIAKEAKR
jgi:hypothetical protein